MSLTPEQNREIMDLRNQLTSALSALNSLARAVGADPIPMDVEDHPLMASSPPKMEIATMSSVPPSYSVAQEIRDSAPVEFTRVAPPFPGFPTPPPNTEQSR